jgi:RNA polymerase sigma-70 factor, ECF subfamily
VSPDGHDVPDDLAAALEAGRRAWPEIELGAAELAEFLAPRLQLLPIDRVHVTDLYLACACARGDERAIAEFRRAFARDLDALFARPNARGVDREDLVQRLVVHLFVGEGDRPPRIVEYQGRGSLRTWLRVVALRVRLNAERRLSDKDDPLTSRAEAALHDEQDAELEFLKAHYRGAFRRALADALADLPASDRSLLRLQLVHGLSATGIADLYKVHRATAKRWLARVRDTVLSATRTRLQKELGVEHPELDSIMRLIGSRLEASVRRHLGTTGVDDGG